MPILLTTLSKIRSIPWIDGVVRAIINVIVSVYELYIRHAGIKNLVSITTIVDFKFYVLAVVHDFVVYEGRYSPDVVVTKMDVIVLRFRFSAFRCGQYLVRDIFEFRHCGTRHSADCVLTASQR